MAHSGTCEECRTPAREREETVTGGLVCRQCVGELFDATTLPASVVIQTGTGAPADGRRIPLAGGDLGDLVPG